MSPNLLEKDGIENTYNQFFYKKLKEQLRI